MSKNLAEEYWKKNLKYLLTLLSIWFTVSFGFGIILIDELKLTDAVLVAILSTVVVTVVAVAKVPPEIEIEEVEVETELTLVTLAWALPVIEISALAA